MTEQPIRFLRLQGIARDWSKHNEHSRNIFSVHGFLRLSVIAPRMKYNDQSFLSMGVNLIFFAMFLEFFSPKFSHLATDQMVRPFFILYGIQ